MAESGSVSQGEALQKTILEPLRLTLGRAAREIGISRTYLEDVAKNFTSMSARVSLLIEDRFFAQTGKRAEDFLILGKDAERKLRALADLRAQREASVESEQTPDCKPFPTL